MLSFQGTRGADTQETPHGTLKGVIQEDNSAIPGPFRRFASRNVHFYTFKLSRFHVEPLAPGRFFVMLARRPIFPGVIEMNHQAGWRIGCNVYLVYDDESWGLIDIGYSEHVDEIIEMIRQMDFPLVQCRALVATHPDVDHVQGLAKAKSVLKAAVFAHGKAVEPLAVGDRIRTFAEISAQKVSMEMPPVTVDEALKDGDRISIGEMQLEVWHTPGHTDSQIALRAGPLLFSGDNIFRDGSVGAIDAHHGSDIPLFIASLERIRASDVEWLLPSHGPIFRKEDSLLDATIERLRGYLKLADFGTCAPDWPLLEEWDRELADGIMPADRPVRAVRLR